MTILWLTLWIMMIGITLTIMRKVHTLHLVTRGRKLLSCTPNYWCCMPIIYTVHCIYLKDPRVCYWLQYKYSLFIIPSNNRADRNRNCILFVKTYFPLLWVIYTILPLITGYWRFTSAIKITHWTMFTSI